MTAGVERASRDVPVRAGFDIADHLSGIGAYLAGAANFTMQLSRPAVGYGVRNSRVHNGSAMHHPVKRSRTTFTYIAVAMLGDDADRAHFRRAVNGQHAQVVSGPDEPEQYRAMDPRLQAWVAACLYYGTVDYLERMHGPLAPDVADDLHAFCGRFGTTLQMPASAWPADRAAFDAYWTQSLAEVRIDPPVRAYLLDLITMRNLPRPFRFLAGVNTFFATGFLPLPFREAMLLPWTSDQDERFARILRRAGRLERHLPRAVRLFPFNALLRDMRRRERRGRPLV